MMIQNTPTRTVARMVARGISLRGVRVSSATVEMAWAVPPVRFRPDV